MNKIYGITKKETAKIDIIAGMSLSGKGSNKLHKVGYKIVEFTYDVNPQNNEDKMLLSEKELKRVML